MPAAVIKGTTTSFGIASAVGTMIATNLSVNSSSNKVEAKNISGGVAAVAFTGKKNEYNLEGYVTATNSVTQGGTFSPTNLTGFAGLSGGYYVEEVNLSKSSEDFSKIIYKVVQRDGIT
jgi:glutamate-1-semialdehyde aminotransferase